MLFLRCSCCSCFVYVVLLVVVVGLLVSVLDGHAVNAGVTVVLVVFLRLCR